MTDQNTKAKKPNPTIEYDDDRAVLNIGLNPDFKENPDPYINYMTDQGYDLAQPYGVDIYPKSKRGEFYTPDEGAFAFYNAFVKLYGSEPMGLGRPPIERTIQVQEFRYVDPDGNFHLEFDLNNPSKWRTKDLYEYLEKHDPAYIASISKWIDDSFRIEMLDRMKATLTIVGAPVRTIQVPWGIVKHPTEAGIKIMPTEDDESYDSPVFRLQILTTKRLMEKAQALATAVEQELHNFNLYKGRCFKWEGDKVVFFDPFEATRPENLVYNKDTMITFENEISGPIIYADRAEQINPRLLSQKILLSGKPGTGKTEMTNWVAQIALRNSHTVGYLAPGANLARLNEFTTFMAKNGRGIKVIEDIETYMPDTEGMSKMQAMEARSLVLAIFDGADSKSVPNTTIATTNNEDLLPPEMLRSGRCDVYIHFEPPGPEEFERLTRMHIGHWLGEDINFADLWSEIGDMTSSFLSHGLITKAQKFALKGDDQYILSQDDITAIIRSLRSQFALYETNTELVAMKIRDSLSEAFIDTMKQANQTV